jgi:hypothetical protein
MVLESPPEPPEPPVLEDDMEDVLEVPPLPDGPVELVGLDVVAVGLVVSSPPHEGA